MRPIELIDGGHEVNEVWFDNVRVPAENLVGEENKGWDYAKFLLGNERVGVAPVGSTKRTLSQAKEYAKTAGPGGTSLLDDPLVAAQIADLENELLALELTALRVVANSADGKPHPASSVLKLRGTELQQAVTELFVDLAGPTGAGVGRRRRVGRTRSGSRRDAQLPQLPQGVDLRRLQRGATTDHRRHDPGTEGLTWTSNWTPSKRPCGTPSAALLAKAYDTSETRRAVTKQDPGWDDKTWRQLAEMGVLGLPFAEEDGGMGAGPAEVSIVAEEIGRVIAPEPFVEAVVLAGGLIAAAGTTEQRAEILGALAEGAPRPGVRAHRAGVSLRARPPPTSRRRPRAATAGRSTASRSRCSAAHAPTCSSSVRRSRAAPDCSSSSPMPTA